jgi:hypothetical protein
VPEGGIRMGLVGLFIDSGANILVGVFSSVAKDKVKGKDIDWGEAFKKNGVKQLPTIGTSLIALLLFKGKDGKRQTDLAKAITSKFYDSKGAIKLLRETDEYKDLAKALDQSLLGKGKIKTFFGKKLNQFKLNKLETKMFEKDAWKIGSGIGKDAAKGFMQTVGSEMAIGFGVDAAVSIGANVLVGCLLEGKSFGESLKDSQWGEEILKSAVKMVCTKSFELIFSAFGCGALGKVIGSAVASFVNAYVCEPFRNSDGEIDQGWCAAAGCAVIGGGILAGCITAAAVSSCVPPVGWIVGLAILAGAAIAYCAVVVAHWVVENWDAITGFFEDNLIAPIVNFLDEAGDFIESVGETVEEVVESKECKIFVNVICL